MTEPKRDLESVQIPEPCNADWAAMRGDEQRRYCDQCELHVHNVAAMPRDEAEALLASRDEGEKVCVRIEYEADGTCVTADEPVWAAPQRRTALALALGTSLLAACRSDEPSPAEAPQALENAAVESAEPAPTAEVYVLQGGAGPPAEYEGCMSFEMFKEADAIGGARMGRISLDGQVTVNSDGQLTDSHVEEGAATPDAEPLQPTMGEVAPVVDEDEAQPGASSESVEDSQGVGSAGSEGESVPVPPAILGTPGPSGPTTPRTDEDDAPPAASEAPASESALQLKSRQLAPLKGRAILGSPGPRSSESPLPRPPDPVPRKN